QKHTQDPAGFRSCFIAASCLLRGATATRKAWNAGSNLRKSLYNRSKMRNAAGGVAGIRISPGMGTGSGIRGYVIHHPLTPVTHQPIKLRSTGLSTTPSGLRGYLIGIAFLHYAPRG